MKKIDATNESRIKNQMPKIIKSNPSRRPPPSLPNNRRHYSTFSLVFCCAIGAIIGLEVSNLSTTILEWFQLGLIIIIAFYIARAYRIFAKKMINKRRMANLKGNK
ncbi:MAG: hypothetical protein CL792_01910 [Chloroflexi bacterium]|nr:hypothetical protein [Chloroflexota bacterium]|tara:strand:+ start:12826 stop:13143 length:318 start_codon:yes stop_codon:yes gene_type:complete